MKISFPYPPEPTNNNFVQSKCYSFDMNGAQIRTIKKGNELWFVAEDVANALGFSNANQVTTSRNIWGNSDFREVKEGTLLVSESGLFSLLIQLNQPEAAQLRRFIGREALPSIRMYETGVVPKQAETVVNAPNKEIELLKHYEAAQAKPEAHPQQSYADALRQLANEIELLEANCPSRNAQTVLTHS